MAGMRVCPAHGRLTYRPFLPLWETPVWETWFLLFHIPAVSHRLSHFPVEIDGQYVSLSYIPASHIPAILAILRDTSVLNMIFALSQISHLTYQLTHLPIKMDGRYESLSRTWASHIPAILAVSRDTSVWNMIFAVSHTSHTSCLIFQSKWMASMWVGSAYRRPVGEVPLYIIRFSHNFCYHSFIYIQWDLSYRPFTRPVWETY